MLAHERYDILTKILLEKNTIKVTEAMVACKVSHETSRRDLEVLQEMGIAKRVHGGAVLITQNGKSVKEPIPMQVQHKLHAGNMAAAKKASQLVHPGDVIFLDSGRTMGHLAQYLRELENLTVVTPSLFVVHNLFGSKVQVICLGGELRPEENTFIGYLTSKALSTFNFDKAFYSCAGLNLKTGLISEYDLLGIHRDFIREHAQKVILVINSEKLRIESPVNFGSLKSVDTIVVDELIKPDEIETITAMGIALEIGPMLESTDDDE